MSHESMLLFDFWIWFLCGCMYLEFDDGLLLSDTKWMMHGNGKQSHNVYPLNGFDSFHTACSQFCLSLTFVSKFPLPTCIWAATPSSSTMHFTYSTFFGLLYLICFSCQYFWFLPKRQCHVAVYHAVQTGRPPSLLVSL